MPRQGSGQRPRYRSAIGFSPEWAAQDAVVQSLVSPLQGEWSLTARFVALRYPVGTLSGRTWLRAAAQQLPTYMNIALAENERKVPV